MAQRPSPRRDINAVLAARDRQLSALPFVVGVYIGVLTAARILPQSTKTSNNLSAATVSDDTLIRPGRNAVVYGRRYNPNGCLASNPTGPRALVCQRGAQQ
jgi:hypothetical protein